jgi:3-hydroxyacyl-[acyl-carrier-protein] dehydratase|tara:strand:- start:1267 stop:1935 length:669 start_codon:yes stop_codon:yes gene_type:complete
MFALSASTTRAAPVTTAKAPRASKAKAQTSVTRGPSVSNPVTLSTRRESVKCFAGKDEPPAIGSAAKGLGKALPMKMDIDAIMALLPHRYPFLLVDRVLEIEQGKYAIGLKNVTINDNFFPGHFPQRPIMPGVLMVEAMAQVGGLIMLDPAASGDGGTQQEFFFAGIDGVKFRRPVVPGDQLVMRVDLTKMNKRFGIAKMKGQCFVGEELACEAELTLALGS